MQFSFSSFILSRSSACPQSAHQSLHQQQQSQQQLQQQLHNHLEPKHMSELPEIPRLGPRTLYSYIRELFKQLNNIEERQMTLIDVYPTTPDPARQITPVPVSSHPAAVKNENVGQGSHNLHYIRLEYYYAIVALKDLVTQVPDAQIDIRRRYLRHILTRLDQVLDRMHFEQGEYNTVVAGTAGVGGGAQYRQIVMRHREMMNRFTTLFKELAHKY